MWQRQGKGFSAHLIEMQKHTAHVNDCNGALEPIQEPPPLFRVQAAAHVFVHKVERRYFGAHMIREVLRETQTIGNVLFVGYNGEEDWC